MPELVELDDADANTDEAGNASEAGDANLAVLVQAANNEVFRNQCDSVVTHAVYTVIIMEPVENHMCN